MNRGNRFQDRVVGQPCGECGKPLAAFRCGECRGSGRRRFLLLWSRQCDTCGATGQIIRCPDAVAHARARVNRAIYSRRRPASRARNLTGLEAPQAKPPGARTCWNCDGAGTIPGKKQIPHPQEFMRSLPGYGMIWVDALINCGVCGGRGWLPPVGGD